MKDGKCPHCGSTDIYFSNNPFGEAFAVKTDAGIDLFKVYCYLCLNCRAIQIETAEQSAALFGKAKALSNEVPKSSNWKKISG